MPSQLYDQLVLARAEAGYPALTPIRVDAHGYDASSRRSLVRPKTPMPGLKSSFYTSEDNIIDDPAAATS